MTLLVPHFRQAWVRANAISQWDSALSSVAVAEADSFGRILFATERATKLIARYRSRDSLSPRMLPEPYRAWLRQNILASEELGAFRALILEAAGRRLTVRLAVLPDQSRYQLHFDDSPLITAAQMAKHFGLTPRQGEVLYWVTEGKSNEEIGLILGAKVRTIAKHVEQIFARISVGNRASATRLWYEAIAGFQG